MSAFAKIESRQSGAQPAPRQSAELMGYLETLFRRMMLTRASCDDGLECSREDMRAIIMLSARAPRTMGDLAQALDVPLSTATHTVGRLVDKGLALRKRSNEDRRVVEIDLSPKGKKMQSGFSEHRLAMAHSWLTPLSRGEREIFLELMQKITGPHVFNPSAVPSARKND